MWPQRCSCRLWLTRIYMNPLFWFKVIQKTMSHLRCLRLPCMCFSVFLQQDCIFSHWVKNKHLMFKLIDHTDLCISWLGDNEIGVLSQGRTAKWYWWPRKDQASMVQSGCHSSPCHPALSALDQNRKQGSSWLRKQLSYNSPTDILSHLAKFQQ